MVPRFAILVAAAASFCVADEASEQSCSSSSPHRFYDSKNYPGYESAADALFIKRYGTKSFGLKPDDLIAAHDGVQRTAAGHFEYMLGVVKDHTRDDAPGFSKIGAKDGVTYEMHDKLTVEAGGAGYFRLKADIACDAKTFVALMADPQALYDMDHTIRLMDFSRGPSYPDLLAKSGAIRRRIWLAYFRQAPGMLLPDLDGIDVSGWEIDQNSGIVWQAAIGVPSVLPTYPALITDLYPPAFRSVDIVWGYKLEPLGEEKTRLTLVCQHDLRNWLIPHFLSNRMVGDVLADYVRTAEGVARKLIHEGRASALRATHGLE
jgi:hypothetical protein